MKIKASICKSIRVLARYACLLVKNHFSQKQNKACRACPEFAHQGHYEWLIDNTHSVWDITFTVDRNSILIVGSSFAVSLARLCVCVCVGGGGGSQCAYTHHTHTQCVYVYICTLHVYFCVCVFHYALGWMKQHIYHCILCH